MPQSKWLHKQNVIHSRFSSTLQISRERMGNKKSIITFAHDLP